jgi:hypothetical protein
MTNNAFGKHVIITEVYTFRNYFKQITSPTEVKYNFLTSGSAPVVILTTSK